MDLHEQRQLELARQMAKVKARARPWRAIIALVLAVVAAAVSYVAGHGLRSVVEPGHVGNEIVTAASAGGFLLFGIAAVVGLAGKSRQALEPVTGSSHASVIRYSIVLIGAVAVLAITLALCKIPVGQLIVGGALTTILIGIAAQQTLSNVFAGIVLLLSRPFNVGDPVVVRSGALGGQYEGTITEVGITYTRLHTDSGPVSLPNSQVLAAAVSRQPAAADGTGGQNGEVHPASDGQPNGESHPAGAGQPASGNQAATGGQRTGNGQPTGGSPGGSGGSSPRASTASRGEAAEGSEQPPPPRLLPPSGAAVQDGGSPAG